MTPEELRRIDAARRLGDPAVPPPGSRVRFKRGFMATVDGLESDELSSFYGETDGLQDGQIRIIVDLTTGAGGFIAFDPQIEPTADQRGNVVVLVDDPRCLELLELPADAPPFDTWVRLSEAELRARGLR